LASTYDSERELTSEVTSLLADALPEVEVLAVEFVTPTRFCVFIDREAGVDHEVCQRVTDALRGFLGRYTVDVSSPGLERPLRKPAHFRQVLGRRVTLRTSSAIDGRKRFRGEVVAASERTLRVAVEAEEIDIPYEELVRGNLIDEGKG
jgi:ribosome maturation factor RimP